MKILQIHNTDNRLDRIIPALEMISTEHGVKINKTDKETGEVTTWYYIIPAAQFQFGNDGYLNTFFQVLAHKCFGTYASIMFIV